MTHGDAVETVTDREIPRWPVWLVWLVTRAGVLVLLATFQDSVLGDLEYYRDSLAALGDKGLDQTLIEYPAPGVALVAIPYAILEWFGRMEWYTTVVPALAVITDGMFLGLLVRARRWGRHDHVWRGLTPAEWVWLLGVPALGATTYARFDLVPGILVGVAVLYAAHRPAFAGMMAAIATSLKYWPALALPAIAAPRRSRMGVLASVAATGGVLALGSVLVGGWHRLFSPFTWQGDRGIQIESIAGTPGMVLWAIFEDPWRTSNTPYNAWEVFGPGVALLEQGTRVLTLVLVLVLGWLWWQAWRHLDHPDDDEVVDAVAWLVLAAVLGFVVSSKVFSPQYLLWALPCAAAGLAVLHNAESWRRMMRWSAVLLVAIAITQPIYPVFYGSLMRHGDWSIPLVALLALRNVLVVWLMVTAFRESWRVLHTAHLPSSESAEAHAEA